MFGDLFGFSLAVVVVCKLSDSLFVPSGGVRLFLLLGHFLFHVGAAKCTLRLGRDVEGSDNECTLTDSVRNLNNLQIPSRLRLTETYPRTISAGSSSPVRLKTLAHFFLGNAVIENVRQIGFWIDPEAQLHAVAPFGSTPLQSTSDRAVREAVRAEGVASRLAVSAFRPKAIGAIHRSFVTPSV